MSFSGLISEELKLVKGLDPVADAFSGTVTSDYVSLAKYDRVGFIIYKGVGATGTSTITIQKATDNTGTGATAIAFKYRAITSGDTAGAITAATAAGFAHTAGSSELYIAEVSSEDVTSGGPWVACKMVEVVDSPIVGAILIVLGNPRYAGATLATAIA